MSSSQPKIQPALLKNLDDAITRVGATSEEGKMYKLYKFFFTSGVTYHLRQEDKKESESEVKSAVRTLQNSRRQSRQAASRKNPNGYESN